MNFKDASKVMPSHFSDILGAFDGRAELKAEFYCDNPDDGNGKCNVTIKWRGIVRCNYHFYSRKIDINFKEADYSSTRGIILCKNHFHNELRRSVYYWPEKYVKNIDVNFSHLKYWCHIPKFLDD